jgi:hypothetical protein
LIFCAGVAAGLNLQGSKPRANRTTIHVFDYRDLWPPIEQRGWTLQGPPQTGELIHIAPDTEFGKVAQVNLPPGVAIDRLLSDECRSAGALEFVGDLGTIYANVVIRSTSVPPVSRQVWLGFDRGDDPPHPHEDGSQEWGFCVQPASQQQQWPVYRLDFARSVRDSFGRSGGWTLSEVVALRLRGRSVVARITLLRELVAAMVA